MKAKRKALALLLICALLLGLSSTACEAPISGEPDPIATPIAVELPELPNGTEVTPDTLIETVDPTQAPETVEIWVEERLLVDRDGVKMTLESVRREQGYYDFLVLIENDSGQPITVQTRDASINGYMVNFTMSDTVAVGKKANCDFTVFDSDLQRCGITTIANLELRFYVFNAENFGDVFKTDIITIETNAAQGFTQSAPKTSQVLLEEQGVKISLISKDADPYYVGYRVWFLIENSGHENITVAAEDDSVNGFAIPGLLFESILAGKSAVTSLSFPKDKLDEHGISIVESIEFFVKINNNDTGALILQSERIILNLAS
ncbi:MAG: hypothetical protein FWF10_07890 [Clostridiales bacterium]|nr:hypothetical protein [Clostridiales bacterium]